MGAYVGTLKDRKKERAEEEATANNTPIDNMHLVAGAMSKQFGGGVTKMPQEYRDMLDWCEGEKKKMKLN